MAERKKGIKRKQPEPSRSGAGLPKDSPRARGRILNNPEDRRRVKSSFPAYNRPVVVKFRDNVQLPYKDIHLVEKYPHRYLRPWQELENQFPGITIRRRITSMTAQQLVDIVKEARQLDPTYCHPDNLFLTYFAVFCPLGIEPRAVVTALRSPMWAKEVELAYLEGRYSQPFAQPGTTSEDLHDQEYLLPAPVGIDAQYAWTFTGGDGGGPTGGLRFLDIEHGWKLNHSDLPSGILNIYGSNQGDKNHGTAVLGIVLGVPNDTGIVGITPNVATTKVASWVPVGTSLGFDQDLANAIAAAIAPSVLGSGDVLLLEVEKIDDWGYYYDPILAPSGRGWLKDTYKVPVEVEDLVYQQILNAKAREIVVVEAAGNGGLDLDAYTHDTWYLGTNPHQLVRCLNTTSAAFKDSFAILVGAADADPPHAPITMPLNTAQGTVQVKLHNYGSRIDCYAWGNRILTTGVNPDDTDSYVVFNDTSGAAAIIAGATLAIQGIAQEYGKGDLSNGRYSPLALRDILRDQGTGTPSSNPSTDKISVMPDLRAILNQKLGIWHHPRHDEAIDPPPDTFLLDVPPDPGPLLDGSESRIARESNTKVHRAVKNARSTKGGRR